MCERRRSKPQCDQPIHTIRQKQEQNSSCESQGNHQVPRIPLQNYLHSSTTRYQSNIKQQFQQLHSTTTTRNAGESSTTTSEHDRTTKTRWNNYFTRTIAHVITNDKWTWSTTTILTTTATTIPTATSVRVATCPQLLPEPKPTTATTVSFFFATLTNTSAACTSAPGGAKPQTPPTVRAIVLFHADTDTTTITTKATITTTTSTTTPTIPNITTTTPTTMVEVEAGTINHPLHKEKNPNFV